MKIDLFLPINGKRIVEAVFSYYLGSSARC
jgi:hypothetical protein